MNTLVQYQGIVNTILDEYVIKIYNKKLNEIVTYSLNGGKRLRPIIMYDIGKQLDCPMKLIEKCMVMVELLHSASLILDDLPCMDNDRYRRGQDTVHIKYGVKPSYITANFMINCAIQNMYSIQPYIKNNVIIDIIVEIVLNSNSSLTLGQLADMDLNLNLNKLSFVIEGLKSNKRIHMLKSSCVCFKNDTDFDTLLALNLKTFPLFYISFQIPFILSTTSNLHFSNENVMYISFIFSLMFQISDDFEDYLDDLKKSGSNNITIIGYQNAYLLFEYCRNEFIKETKELDSRCLKHIVQKLTKKIELNFKGNG